MIFPNVFSNNINVFSRTFNKYLKHFRLDFILLKSNNVKLKIRKNNNYKHLRYIKIKYSKQGLNL